MDDDWNRRWYRALGVIRFLNAEALRMEEMCSEAEEYIIPIINDALLEECKKRGMDVQKGDLTTVKPSKNLRTYHIVKDHVVGCTEDKCLVCKDQRARWQGYPYKGAPDQEFDNDSDELMKIMPDQERFKRIYDHFTNEANKRLKAVDDRPKEKEKSSTSIVMAVPDADSTPC